MARVTFVDFLPFIAQATAALADGVLEPGEGEALLENLKPLVRKLEERSAKPPTPVIVPPPIIVLPPPAPLPTPTPGAFNDIAEIRGRLKDVWKPTRLVNGLRGVHEDDAYVASVNTRGSTSHFQRGQFLCHDWTCILDDGSVLHEDDPRWHEMNAGWSQREQPGYGNEAVVFSGYEVNGRQTDGADGAPGQGTQNPGVDPQSVVSDGPGRPWGCTPVHEIDLTDGDRYRATAEYRRKDGRMIRGIYGRGNVNGAQAEPFTFEG